MTEAPNGLYTKIARIMGRLDRLPKTGVNKHFNYAFVTDSDVSDAIRRELAAENIAFFASMVEATQTGPHTVATFEFTFVCADTGESKVCLWTGEANDNQDKGLSKAATSAEKYFLLKTFMLSTGDKTDDPDGDEPQKPNAKRTAPLVDDGNGNSPADPRDDGDLDDIVWTRDADTVSRFVDWVRGEKGIDNTPHAVNLICKALGLTSPKGKPQMFKAVLAAEYAGSKADAIELIRAYESTSDD